MNARDYERARSALAFIPPDDRVLWVSMGMAIKDGFGDEGFALWAAWSRRSDRYDERDARDVWRSLKAGGGITLGSLFHEAKARGWRDDGTRQKPMSEEIEVQRRQAAERTAKEEVEERARHEAAAARAAEILAAATGDPAAHPYAIKKRLRFGPLVRRGLWPQRGWPDALLVPIYDGDGRLWSIEAINADADGNKDSLKGAQKRGGFHPLGKIRGASRVLIAEGLANAAVGCAVDGSPAAAAMGKSNLLHAALAARKLELEAEIIILADNDLNVPREAQDAARAVGGRVAVPDLEGRKGDFWDLWHGHGVEAVQCAIAGAKAPAGDEARSGNGAASGGVCVAEAVYRRLSDIQPKPIRWLWRGRIARGKVFMLAGHPGLGKSQVMISVAAIVTTGGLWPVDRTQCEVGSVIILSAEDDAEDTIRPRLEAAGVDLKRVFILDAIRERNRDGGLTTRPFNLTADIERLSDLARKLGDVALIEIDPLTAYMGGVDSHKNAEVRAVLAPLAAMAAETGYAIVCVSHLTKDSGPEAMLRVMGSLGFVAAARAAYLVAKDPDDETRRVFLPMKNNLAEDRGGLAFWVKGKTLESGIETSCVEWGAEAVTMTADEAMAPAWDPEERSELDEAVDWLGKLLANGSVDSKEICSDAKQAGIAWRTLERAKTRLGVKASKASYSGAWRWSLAGHSDPNPAHNGGLGGLGELESPQPSCGAGSTQDRQPPKDDHQNRGVGSLGEKPGRTRVPGDRDAQGRQDRQGVGGSACPDGDIKDGSV